MLDHDDERQMKSEKRPEAAFDTAYGELNKVMEDLDKNISVLRDRLTTVSLNFDGGIAQELDSESASSPVVRKVIRTLEHATRLNTEIIDMTRALEI